MNAVDTNVYVDALDADEADKQAKALELFDRLTQHKVQTVLIWQVAGEFLNQLRTWESRGRLTAARWNQHFSAPALCSSCGFHLRRCFRSRSICDLVSASRIGTACYWQLAKKQG